MKRSLIQFVAYFVLATLPLTTFAVGLSEVVPDFTLKSLTGENLRMQEYRGKVVLINFWASWCGPCRQEMPILARIHERYEPMGFVVLGVNVDEDEARARRIVERLKLDFPLVLDSDQKVSEQFDVSAMPFTVLVDRDGKIDFIHQGYKPGDESKYVNRLRQLIKSPVSISEGQ